MKRYLQFLKDYKVQCILGPLFKWIEAALELLVPLVMANIIDVGVAERASIGYVLAGGGVMLAMGAVGFCAGAVGIAPEPLPVFGQGRSVP